MTELYHMAIDKYFICGTNAGNPERARWAHLAHSGSQSECSIRFTLADRGFSHIIYNNIDSNKGSIYMSVFASDQRSPQVKLSLEPFYSCRLQSLTVLLFFSQVCITDLYYCINQLRTINLGLGKLLIEMDHIRHALLLVYQCFLGLRRKCLST